MKTDSVKADLRGRRYPFSVLALHPPCAAIHSITILLGADNACRSTFALGLALTTRTGANDATVLATDRDLMIGGTLVPAGSYSLFTIPARAGTTLIINRETMRNREPLAGTEYDASKDLARIPMTTATSLATPVEQLTIEVVPRGASDGLLQVKWDRRGMMVPIELRR